MRYFSRSLNFGGADVRSLNRTELTSGDALAANGGGDDFGGKTGFCVVVAVGEVGF